jgi:methylmalonyl-CoA mutase
MKNLFDDFNPVSSKQWKQKIQYELNGADYNETLIWNSPEDIQVKPFYHKDEFKGASNVNTKATNFLICQNIYVHDLEKSNLRAIDSLNRGAESIRFTIEDDKIEVAKLLQNLPLDKITIYFNLSFLSIDFIKKIETLAKEKKNKNILQPRPNWPISQRRKLVYYQRKNKFRHTKFAFIIHCK